MRRIVSCFMLMLAITLHSTPASAADAKWIHATSAHFDMYAAESESDARAALQHLEAVRAYYTSSTHSQDPDGQPVRIVVFQSAGDFNKYRPAEYTGANAFSLAGPPATIVALGLKPEMYEKIFLEYCQLVMDQSAPKVPYWLRAGLAQFYSTLKPVDAGMKLGAPPSRAFHSHPTSDIDIIQLVEVNRAAYLGSRNKAANDFYADTSKNSALTASQAAATSALNAVQTNISQDFEGEAWTFTHMLMFSPDYRSKVGELIGAMGSGQDTGAAFNSVYGRSLNQVRVDLQLYMKQPALAVATPKFAYEKPPAPQVKPAAKEEQDRIFADLGKKAK